jgi:Mn2+/Fe2+ NRAMP family transporter
VNSQKSRRGTAADRGRVLRFPPPAPPPPHTGSARRWLYGLRRLGPGVVTGAANVDPSLVVTATVAGAAYQYNLLWAVVLCIPFLFVVYTVSGRIGFETRKGLVDLLRENYGRNAALTCAAVIVVINMAMIVADLMAVSDAFSIILEQRRAFFVAAAAFTVWYVLIFRDYRKITHALLWLALPLFVYVAAALLAVQSWPALLRATVAPRVAHSADYVAALVGLLGSLLTPYILVWQTSSRREQAVLGQETPHAAQGHAGTFVTTVLSLSVMVAAGSVLRLAHPMDMTTRQAAEALRPAVGALGQVVFALGIIGAGMVALPVLTASMCYSISEAAGWPAGLSEHPWDAKRFYVLISAAMFVAVAANFLPINPVKALFWSQILAGILTIPVLLFILTIANDRRIMGSINTRWQNFWIGAAAGGLVAAGLAWAWRGLRRNPVPRSADSATTR